MKKIISYFIFFIFLNIPVALGGTVTLNPIKECYTLTENVDISWVGITGTSNITWYTLENGVTDNIGDSYEPSGTLPSSGNATIQFGSLRDSAFVPGNEYAFPGSNGIRSFPGSNVETSVPSTFIIDSSCGYSPATTTSTENQIQVNMMFTSLVFFASIIFVIWIFK